MMTVTTAQTTPHGGQSGAMPAQTTNDSAQHARPTAVSQANAHHTPSTEQSADGAARPGPRRAGIGTVRRVPSTSSITLSFVPILTRERRLARPPFTSKPSTVEESPSFPLVPNSFGPPYASATWARGAHLP